MTDKQLLERLKIQSMIYVSFKIVSLHERSIESVFRFVNDLYEKDPIYSGYINAITELTLCETNQ